MRNNETRKQMLYIYERLRDQQEFISDLTILMAPLLESLSESCLGFSEIYKKNCELMQPKVIRAKLDSLRELEDQIEKLRAGTD